MKKLGVLLILCVVVSCGVPSVVYDYDKKTSFDQYKTYGIFPDIQTGLSELDNKRLFFQLDSVLQSKGFRRSVTPDFHINVVAEEYQDVNRNSVGIGIGGTGRNVGVGVSGGIPIGGSRLTQRVVFDLIDVKRNELFWQASAAAPVRTKTTPVQREEHFRKMVAKVFAKFPPKKRK
ncbi:DUF4136 domain-containing protein [Leptobacterium flavescens]|uniref:DUF4136 domain-containing protein n=1 Tax=Leptobacterium flavescens TaxID=472055 RepID=A0A6P0UP44_9FLAO|nr:DUF4136 domain-containing protein [Leptobacterium flavescens]NER15141.1 DUF4136 domain-containing protein [Leptobacterium flavescens]